MQHEAFIQLSKTHKTLLFSPWLDQEALNLLTSEAGGFEETVSDFQLILDVLTLLLLKHYLITFIKMVTHIGIGISIKMHPTQIPHPLPVLEVTSLKIQQAQQVLFSS